MRLLIEKKRGLRIVNQACGRLRCGNWSNLFKIVSGEDPRLVDKSFSCWPEQGTALSSETSVGSPSKPLSLLVAMDDEDIRQHADKRPPSTILDSGGGCSRGGGRGGEKLSTWVLPLHPRLAWQYPSSSSGAGYGRTPPSIRRRTCMWRRTSSPPPTTRPSWI